MDPSSTMRHSRSGYKPEAFDCLHRNLENEAPGAKVAEVTASWKQALETFVGRRVLRMTLSGATDVEAMRRNAEAIFRMVTVLMGRAPTGGGWRGDISVNASLSYRTIRIPVGFRSPLGSSRSLLGDSFLLGDRTLESFLVVRITFTIPRDLYEKFEVDRIALHLLREALEQAIPLHLDCEVSFEIQASERVFVLGRMGDPQTAILGVTTALDPC